MKKKIISIGGGTGQASILSSLKKLKNINIVSVVGVTDNGGYSGIIRESMGIPQPGDSRNCIGALCNDDLLLSKLINYRFTEGKLSGISLGNLIIAALTRITGDFSEAIEQTGHLAGIAGKVLPVSKDSTHICAKLEDGRNIVGEWEIIKREPRSKILELYLDSPAKINPSVEKEIIDSDFIIICPGSLCTAIISTLLIQGVKESIKKSNAKIIYISNIMTQAGQTDNFSLSNHVSFIEKYLDKKIDILIVNNSIPSSEILEEYKKEDSLPVEIDICNISNHTRIIFDDLLLNDIEFLIKNERPKSENMHVGKHLIRHDPDKLAKIIDKIIHEK
ncbi:MAG: putative gluconeogenesis factor [Candidatus Sericytochromatia bacterium]|nr:MAG: putative gluconeogenesis factor [Candidatus Sericytochromatia bacterium]